MFDLAALGVAGVLALVLLVTRQMGHRALAPLGLTLLYWVVVLALPSVAGAQFDADSWAPRVVLGACLLFAAGYLVSGASVGAGSGVRIITPRWFGLLMPLGFLAGLGSAVLVVRANGLRLDLGSWASIMGASKDVTVLRYGGELRTPVVASVLMALCFAACLVAPFLGRSVSRPSRAIYRALPMGGAAAFTILTTARTPFLIAAGMTVASGITAYALAQGRPPALDRRRIVSGALLTVAVVVLFSAGYLIRYGAKGMQTLGDRISVYSSGSVPALSNWHAAGGTVDPDFGRRTFGGIVPGAENTLYEFRSVAPATSTNVYTVFRALIEDFTVPGMFAIAVVTGFLVGASWQGVLRGARPRLSVWVVVAFTAAAMLGLLSSIYSFTNVCLGFGVFAGLLVLMRFEPVPTAKPPTAQVSAPARPAEARRTSLRSVAVDGVHHAAAGPGRRDQ